MRFRLFVAVWWGCLLLLSTGQPLRAAPHPLRDRLELRAENDTHVSEAYRYFTEPFSVPPDPVRIDSLWRAGAFRAGPWHRPLNLGFLHQRVWLRLEVENGLPRTGHFLWSIYNFTDSATLYVRRDDQRGFARVAASAWVPAQERVFPGRAVSLPFALEAGQHADLYLRIDHRAGAIYLPTYVESAEEHLAWEATYPFERHWIWLLGFYLSSALFNLVLFAFLRDQIHIWYVLYVVSVTVFLIMEDNIDSLLLPRLPYQFIWSVGQFNFMLLAMACEVRIMQLFLRLRDGWPRLNRAGYWLAGTAVGFVVVYTLLFPAALSRGETYPAVLNTIREVLLFASFVYGWTVLIAMLLSRRRRLGLYYAFTYFFFFVGFMLFWLNHLGLTNFNLVNPNALAWGLVLELLVLSALLTGRFRHTLRQNNRLRLHQLDQRNRLSARLIAAQEEERNQLARELHDSLGPNLAALHMALQGPAVRTALAASPEATDAARLADLLMRHLRDEVRTFSHSLRATSSGQGNLAESVGTLVELLNFYGDQHVQLYRDEGLQQLPAQVQQAGYRITSELLNYAVRHARAREIHVQLLRHPGALEIMVEDDGRPPAEAADAHSGLRGVRARTEYMRGEIHIDSSPHGSSIIVRLPIP